ncbi:hypothetical protein PVL30_004851 [Lodderomyces elongisporus]|uniref:uncharacterized protein n=1 Tax=Lodderomyces elongisporus TaxID=36914 RepID=UPI0029263873|nr:uncharacterized protein PVL30_004851 [Lodderomyces elongisporus]WLF81057.1 hypothetical protein PVL30_004851 [Lodderomyces elongisporus]
MVSVKSPISVFLNELEILNNQLLSNSSQSIRKIAFSKLNTSLDVLTIQTSATMEDIATLKNQMELLFQMVYNKDYSSNEDKMNWFCINLFLNPFVRHHHGDLIKLFWPLLLRIVIVQTEEITSLYKLIDDALDYYSYSSWLSSKILLSMSEDIHMSLVISQAIDSRDNLAKFHKLLNANRSFSTLITLIELFVALGLKETFLPNLTEPYIKYIYTFNPKFKNLIQCAVTCKAMKMSGDTCYLQPINKQLLNLWTYIGSQIYCYHLNLVVFAALETHPDKMIKMSFECSKERQTRSKSTMKEVLKSFSIRDHRGHYIFDTSLDVKVEDIVHYNWLINYLKALRCRKISINTALYGDNPDLKDVKSKSNSPVFETSRDAICKQYKRKRPLNRARSQASSNNTFDEGIRKKQAANTDVLLAGQPKNMQTLTSSCNAIMDDMGEKNDKGTKKSVSDKEVMNFLMKPTGTKKDDSFSKTVPKVDVRGQANDIVQPIANDSLPQGEVLNRAFNSPHIGNLTKEVLVETEKGTKTKTKTEIGTGTGSGLRLGLESKLSFESIDSESENIKAPKVVHRSRIVDTQALMSPKFKTSTPTQANNSGIASADGEDEITDFPDTTAKTSVEDQGSPRVKPLEPIGAIDAMDPMNVMHQSLKLYSANLINKLKLLEYKTLTKRNELQDELDREFLKLEKAQCEKLKQIQEYCAEELAKI